MLSSTLQDFMSKLKDPSTSGAVFFAVCRGKVPNSEIELFEFSAVLEDSPHQ